MATLLVKSLAVAGGLGGVSALGYGTYYLTTSKEEKKTDSVIKDTAPKEATVTKKKVTEFLKGKGLKIIPKGDSKWTEKWGSFKSANQTKAPSDPWKFSKATLSEEDLDSFKQQCEELSKKEIINETDTIYVQLSTHCSTELTSEERQA